MTMQPGQHEEGIEVKVLRSGRRRDTYLFLCEEDEYENLPEALRTQFGEATEFLNFTLTADRKLAQVQAHVVMQALQTQGFYLQLPPNKDAVDSDG